MVELVNENKLGIAQGSPIEEAVEANFRGETSEVGLYLAMARQAQREGYGEIAEALEAIAREEAEHAARYAELGGKISASTKENLEKMLAGEAEANKGKRQAAVKAKEAGVDEPHGLFDETSRDEARHARALEGLLKRYFLDSVRKSKAREVILEELRSLKTHPRGDELFQIVRQRLPQVSLGTVYRNLNLMRREGLVLELFCGDFNRYDGNVSLHAHFLCHKCGCLWDFDAVATSPGAEVAASRPFRIDGYYVVFYGLCQQCLASEGS